MLYLLTYYGKNITEMPRKCVFFATTNNTDFLKGTTGNRRLWPINIGINKSTKNIHEEITEELRGLVWAEAKYYFENGESLWLGKELEQYAKGQQEEHRETDPWEELIDRYVNTLWPTEWRDIDIRGRYNLFTYPESSQTKGEVLRDMFTHLDIWHEAIGGQTERADSATTRRINAIMRQRKDFKEEVLWAGGTKRGFTRIVPPKNTPN